MLTKPQLSTPELISEWQGLQIALSYFQNFEKNFGQDMDLPDRKHMAQLLEDLENANCELMYLLRDSVFTAIGFQPSTNRNKKGKAA